MKTGYIKIEETDAREWIVEAKLIDGTLWLTKHEMARLLGVYVNTIGNNLRAIFKSGVLREQDVIRVHEYEHAGKTGFTTLYNLEALIFISYRVASFQARAFRAWVMNALCEYNRLYDQRLPELNIILCLRSR